MLQAPPPGRRQQVELNRENQDEHDAQPEGRHRLAEKRDHGGHVVGERVAAHRGDDAGRNGQAQGDEEPRPRQLEGRGHALEHEIERGLTVPDRLAEVSPEGARQKAPVLHDEGIVEPHHLAEAKDVLGGGVRRQEHEGRIAGQIEDEEHHEGDAEEDEKRLEQPSEQVDLHTPCERRATASM